MRFTRTDLQLRAGVEVVGARTSLESAERDAGATQRRDVTEVVAAGRPRLVVPGHGPLGRHAVRRATRRAVELIRRPVRRLARSTIDGKAFRTTRMKLESNVRYLERLAFRQHAEHKDRFVHTVILLLVTDSQIIYVSIRSITEKLISYSPSCI